MTQLLLPAWRTVALLCGLLAGLCATPAHALPEDREQPIHITADKAVRDEKRGLTVYSGNVEMRQGSMELEADTLTIYHEANDANKIVARGAPARMRQQPEIDKGLVHAHAAIITYLRDVERVNLRKGAHLERDDGTLVTGDSIDYFIIKQLVKAESDRNDEDNKVVVVIPPSVHQGAAADDAPPPGDDAGTPPESTAAPEAAPAPGEAGSEDGADDTGPATEDGGGGGTQGE